MDRIVSVCGLICSDCGAYQATQAGDAEWLERVAAQWREEYKNPKLTAAAIPCDGCLATSGRLCAHCCECRTRACGQEHNVVNCAECSQYETCTEIQGFFQWVPSAKVVLDEIHAALR
ncbi:MAG: DUF3795 domain-containing protein [Anaerolineaceae bacterium]|nr:DUF3795 domain-containing protein [Anaerolineaceae bacterium]